MTQEIQQTQTQSQISFWDNNESENQQPQADVLPWGRLIPKFHLIPNAVDKAIYYEDQKKFDLTATEFKVGRIDVDFAFERRHLPKKLLERISKVHFVITRKTKSQPAFLEDKSRNGTFVNNEKVGQGNLRILQTNDVIAVSHESLKVFLFQDMEMNTAHNLPRDITSKYYISRELGKGACGIVRLVYDLKTGGEFAMKEVVKNKLADSKQNLINDPERIMNEVAILQGLEHPCIIKMHDLVDRTDSVFMVLELMRGGDMINRISKSPQKRLPEHLAKFYFLQMCHALKYLHDNGITHRDIKPDNILLASDEEETVLKITDFGLSKFVQKNSVMKTLCGTPHYVAPEILTERGQGSYTKKVDIWSLGCCLYACLAGCIPFTGGAGNDAQKIANEIVHGRLLFDRVKWRNVSKEAMDVVRNCLIKDPQKRPSIDDLLKYRWLEDGPIIKKVETLLNIRLATTSVSAHIHSMRSPFITNARSSEKQKTQAREYIDEPPLKRPRIDRS